MMLHRQQFDRGDTKMLQILEHDRMRQPGISAALCCGNAWMLTGAE